ncbi:MAG TPA: hypothetical protein VLG50_06455 [Candidatus Saccharimonadales bacterium]|nr:hypothetical protein [Candidatus Saccharimonadales bacterium]
MDSGQYVENMTSDVLYNIILNADHDEMKQLCLTNTYAQQLCNNKTFWEHKMNHFNLESFIHISPHPSLNEYKKTFRILSNAKNRTDRLFQLAQKEDKVIDFTVNYYKIRPVLNIQGYNPFNTGNQLVIFSYHVLKNNVNVIYHDVYSHRNVLYTLDVSAAKFIFMYLFYHYSAVDIGIIFHQS